MPDRTTAPLTPAEVPLPLPLLSSKGGQPGHGHCWHGTVSPPRAWCCWCGAATVWQPKADGLHGPYVHQPREEQPHA